MKIGKKALLFVFTMAMFIGLAGFTNTTPTAQAATGGSCGDINWSITNGVLTLSGSGDYELTYSENKYPAWKEYSSQITSAVVSIDKITSTNSMFAYCSKLQTITFKKFDTSQVTDMSNMFYDCESLTELDVSQFDTGKVTDMSGMFCNCQKLTELDVSNFETGKVTDMSNMFNGCESLTELDVSQFDTGKVTNMYGIFASCLKLTKLDVSQFDTGKVTNMHGMFANCSKLTQLDVSSFDTGNVTDMSSMFYGCPVTELNLSGFDTGNVTDMSYMFSECSHLKSLDLRHFNTGKVTNMAEMFNYCKELTELDVSSFDTGNVTNMGGMFSQLSALKKLNLDHFDTSKVTDVRQMFYACSALTTAITFRSKVTSYSSCFQNAATDSSAKITIRYDGVNCTAALARQIFATASSSSNVFLSDSPIAELSNCTATLDKTSFTYDGTAKAPSVTVMNGAVTLVKGTDYSVSGLSGNKTIGKYTITLTGCGNYTNTKKLTYTIVPQGTTVSTLTDTGTTAKVTWKKQAVQVTGYQLQYAGNTSFTNAKTVTVNSNATTSKTISGIHDLGKCYVRVRTFKTVSGVNYPSAWSAVKLLDTTSIQKASSVAAKNAASGICVSWKDTAAADGYQIFRKAKGASKYALLKTVTGKSFTDTVAANGTFYTYKIRRFVQTDSKISYGAYSATVTYCRLTRPKITAITNPSKATLKVKWSGNSKASGYKIYISLKKSFTKNISFSTTSAKRSLSGAKKGKTYYAKVIAYKKSGSKYYYSAYSTVKSIKIKK